MRRMILPLMLFALLACQPAEMELTDAERAAIRDTVTQLADEVFEAFRARDIDRFMAPYNSEFIWAENGVLSINRDSIASAWRDLFASWRDVTGGDWRDVHVGILGRDAAVFTATFDWTGVDSSGSQIGASGVWTTIWAPTDEGWKIILGHESFVMPESM